MAQRSAIDVLRSASLRATPGRMALFKVLLEAAHPLTIEELHTKVGKVDLVTVYRTLEHLFAKNIVRTVHFKNGPVRYELRAEKHHHHIVCTECGRIEELPDCDFRELEQHALERSSFNIVLEHTLEFFGVCKRCVAV